MGGVIGSATASTGTPASATANTADACPVSSVADQVIPSVVTISAQGSAGGGSGSGEVIRPAGYILTNNHVISPAASGGNACPGDSTSPRSRRMAPRPAPTPPG